MSSDSDRATPPSPSNPPNPRNARTLSRFPIAAPAAIYLLVITVATFTLWTSAGDHSLYTPDEGRYASASQIMVRGGSWIIPEYEGKPHLTKPPLTYWLQALAMRVLGENELAARAPSLFAATLTLLLTGWFASRLKGIRAGAIAAGALGIMPLHLFMGRLASTDALLALFWFGTLAFGALRHIERKRIWLAPMWLCVALGVMTKGPLALFPLVALLLWHAFGGRWRAIAALWIPLGLPLALAPTLAWAWAVVDRVPGALDIWRHETLDRATGSGDHPRSVWFYIPIFIGGLFPASAMLTLPGLNYPLRRVPAQLKAGSAATLMGLAVLAPLLLFTLMRGKLPSYLLPLAPPLAILTAFAIERILTRAAARAPGAARPPAVALGVSIGLAAFALAPNVAAVMLNTTFLPRTLPFLALLAVAAWMLRVWKRTPALRGQAVLVAWLSLSLTWWWVFEIENLVRIPSSAARLVADIRAMTAPGEPVVYRFGFRDPTITFYLGMEPAPISSDEDIHVFEAAPADRSVLIVDADRWRSFVKHNPEYVKNVVQVGAWIRWPNDDVLLFRPASAVKPTPTSH